eukprot:3192049-Rhodomonas_salina.2
MFDADTYHAGADALRFVFSQLNPFQIRQARQVSRCWRECADDGVLWKAHILYLRLQEKMAPSILCNEMWGPPGATNDNLGMLSVFSNFQTYRQTGKVHFLPPSAQTIAVCCAKWRG